MMSKNARYGEMPSIDNSVESVAKAIKKMNKRELETLTLLLTDDGRALLKRKKEIESGKVKAVSRDDIFEV
ncbi:MAG: hypothetical protein JW838_10365 [Spirochaetes bacterium]|nr:hypothetical protein [Spirochaetota bacterium]